MRSLATTLSWCSPFLLLASFSSSGGRDTGEPRLPGAPGTSGSIAAGSVHENSSSSG